MDYSYTTTNYAMQPQYNPFANPIFSFFIIIFAIFVIAAYWKIFTKAGKPGWAAIIPFYNIYILLHVVKRPGWWLILYFVPIVNIIISIIVAIDLAKVFKKDAIFGVFLNFFFHPIGQLILGYGKAKYTK